MNYVWQVEFENNYYNIYYLTAFSIWLYW